MVIFSSVPSAKSILSKSMTLLRLLSLLVSSASSFDNIAKIIALNDKFKYINIEKIKEDIIGGLLLVDLPVKNLISDSFVTFAVCTVESRFVVYVHLNHVLLYMYT
jgi:hypothetical protein